MMYVLMAHCFSDIKGKLKDLANKASTAGLYIIEQKSNKMKVNNNRIQKLKV